MAIPTDTMLSSQWHLIQTTAGLLDLNVSGAWQSDYSGAGIDVFVIDDGFDYNHSDLAANYDQVRDFDFAQSDSDPFGLTTDSHGTAVAGLIAADDNGTGVVGLAFDATVVGYRYGGASLDAAVGSVRDGINAAPGAGAEVINMSLGISNIIGTVFGGLIDQSIIGQIRTNIGTAVDSGRSGLGVLIAKSAGNKRAESYDANAEMWGNDTRQVVVAAVDQNGFVSSYSSYGAPVLVSAFGTPSQVVTTDRVGSAGYHPSDFTSTFNGTSAAAPMVAGVMALMLDANPNLGWRDVQTILANSARHVGTAVGGGTGGSEREAWYFNGADNWNGGGLHHSIDYGYGLADATKATRLAETWLLKHSAQTGANQTSTIQDGLDATIVIPDGNAAGTTFNINEAEAIDVERVALTVSFSTTFISDVEIYLTSPEGTTSTLVRDIVESDSTVRGNDFNSTWIFESQAFRGERSNGTWQVRIVDDQIIDTLSVSDLVLRTFGGSDITADRHVFTDDYSVYAGLFGHATTITADGGIDIVNASAVSTSSVIRLTAGQVSSIDGVSANLNGFSDAIGGDGGDVIEGTTGPNALWGMRGNDFLDGGGDADTLRGGAGNDSYAVDNALDRVDEGTSADAPGSAGTDTVVSVITFSLAGAMVTGSIENLTLLGSGNIHGTGNSLANQITGNSGHNILNGSAGADTLSGGHGNDLYVIETPADVASETGGSGIDTIQSQLAISLAARGIAFENAVLVGGGHFSILGNAAANKLTGNSGNNLLDGSGGIDNMLGGSGNDVYRVDNGSDVTSEAGGSGTDLVVSTVNRSLGAGIENLTLAGAASLGFGNELSNLINGSAGNNMLFGLQGNDTMNGGGGSDRFVFSTPFSAANIDTVLGFSVVDDLIALDDLVFTGIGATLDADEFVLAAAAQDAEDRIVYDRPNGDLYFDFDGTGGGTAFKFADMALNPNLTRLDFQMV